MRYRTKAAPELTRDDRVVVEGKTLTVLDQRGIVSKHSPGRIGYTVRGRDGRVYKLSVPDDERLEIAE